MQGDDAIAIGFNAAAAAAATQASHSVCLGAGAVCAQSSVLSFNNVTAAVSVPFAILPDLVVPWSWNNVEVFVAAFSSFSPLTYSLAYDMSNYNFDAVASYLQALSTAFAPYTVTVSTYPRAGASMPSTGYFGGAWAPLQQRVYFIPNSASDITSWVFVDCAVDPPAIGTYTVSALVDRAYYGGAYSPSQDRVYMAPRKIGTESTWHYIDCAANAQVGYSHGLTSAVDDGNFGAVYSPVSDFMYFVPFIQSTQPMWHFIDCSTGAAGEYAAGSGASYQAYVGGAYSPSQDRIYMAPRGQSGATDWHYIDCSAHAAVTYTHGYSLGSNGQWFDLHLVLWLLLCMLP